MAYVLGRRKPNLTFPTLTGSIVTFNSQYAGLPLKSHKIALTATQSGSGTPSPDNVRPINGYSAIGVAHSNRNILPYTLEDIINANGGQSTWTDNQKTINGLTFTLNTDSNGKLTSITINGTATYNTAFYLHSRFTSIYFPASTLYSGVSSAVSGYSARISHSGGQIISSTSAEVAKKTYSNCDIILFFNAGNAFDITVSPRLILSGESDNSYVPHEGTYTTIQIGSTVYGGEYDARSGVLTVTHLLASITIMQRAASGTFFYDITNGIASSNMLCNMADFGAIVTSHTQAPSYPKQVCLQQQSDTNLRVLYYNADYTYEDWSTFIANNPFVVCVECQPTTIQLPSCPIETLLGENNIWADTGETTLQYPKFG